jgi:L-ornithine Nalpha-acyltransferase
MEPGHILATRGDLCIRLAASLREVEVAQRLRYQVFYEEMGANPRDGSQSDIDRFDPHCDHLIAIDRAGRGDFQLADGAMIGTYRLLRQSQAKVCGFYTQGEFDIAPLLARHPELQFLELGRSCVLRPYRTRPAAEMLWQGIWNYVRLHKLDVMIGCASLEGADPVAHANTLSFLATQFVPPPEWSVTALAGKRVEMRLAGTVDGKQALRELPTLIKGYLRLGCYIGDGAVIDEQFNTIDVLIVLPISAIDKRYFTHYGAPDEAVSG